MERIIADAKSSGIRLDRYLTGRLTDVSRSRIQRMIEEGAILLNGTTVSKRHHVSPGDVIEMREIWPGPEQKRQQAQDIPVEVLFEDDFILAVNKPAGLVVHPGNGNPDKTLVNALLFHKKTLSEGFSGDRPGIVHRLDKPTSGVLLVAKKNSVHHRLAAAFAKREVRKEYLGICIGLPHEDNGIIKHPLARSRSEPLKRTVSQNGKEARTTYQLVTQRCGISIIRFFPHTGRTHQIRVHCGHAGFPILADTLYGGGRERILRIEPAERPFAYTVFKCFQRHALHAQKITFRHPENNTEMTISAPLPEDFIDAIRNFGEPDLLAMVK